MYSQMRAYAQTIRNETSSINGDLKYVKIAAWNVNSLKVRLPQLLDFLATRQPDAVCLQKTKSTEANTTV